MKVWAKITHKSDPPSYIWLEPDDLNSFSDSFFEEFDLGWLGWPEKIPREWLDQEIQKVFNRIKEDKDYLAELMYLHPDKIDN